MLKFRRKSHSLICLALCAILSMSTQTDAKSPRKRHKQRETLEFIYYVDEGAPFSDASPAQQAKLLQALEPRPTWKPEKPPLHWPSNLSVPNDPHSWEPPRDRFDAKVAAAAVLAPFAAGLDPADRRFGEIPKHAHIDGFVRLPLRLPRNGSPGTKSVLCEVSIVWLGPRNVTEVEDDVIKAFLIVTSGGRMLSQKVLGETGSGAAADHYTLSRVITNYGKDPMVLLFADSGGNTRGFFYTLYRVRADGVEEIWHNDWDTDGHSGSMQQGYGQSNFDFSAMRSGRVDEFQVYTTSGCRRWMEPGDEELLKTTYTKRVYRWDDGARTFVKTLEHSFHR